MNRKARCSSGENKKQNEIWTRGLKYINRLQPFSSCPGLAVKNSSSVTNFSLSFPPPLVIIDEFHQSITELRSYRIRVKRDFLKARAGGSC